MMPMRIKTKKRTIDNQQGRQEARGGKDGKSGKHPQSTQACARLVLVTLMITPKK
jgi:hypothetical protein